jgi:hypothetical protein
MKGFNELNNGFQNVLSFRILQSPFLLSKQGWEHVIEKCVEAQNMNSIVESQVKLIDMIVTHEINHEYYRILFQIKPYIWKGGDK